MEPNGVVVADKQTKPELTWVQRREIYMRLELVAHGDDVPHGIFVKMEMDYPVAARALSAVWKDLRAKVKEYFGGQENINHGNFKRTEHIPDEIFYTNKLNCAANGRKNKISRVAIQEALKLVRASHRQTYRAATKALDGLASRTTIHAMVQEEALKVHSSALKPFLTLSQRQDRIMYALSMIERMEHHHRVCRTDVQGLSKREAERHLAHSHGCHEPSPPRKR